MNPKTPNNKWLSPITQSLTSLRGRLLVLIVLATFPVVLFIFLLASQERAAQLARMESDARHVAHLVSREHSQQIRGARELLRWLGGKLGSEGARSIILTDPAFLHALLAGHPQLANIGVLTPGGQVLTSAYPVAEPATMAENPAYRSALQSTDVATGTYLVSPILKRPTLNHAYAVRDTKGQVTAVLFCGLDLAWLSHIAGHAGDAGGFSMLIADRDGFVLTRVPALAIPGSEADSIRIPEIAEVATAQRGRFLKIRGADTAFYFVSARLHDDPNLYVAVGLPYEQVVGKSEAIYYRTLLLLVLLTLLTALTVYFATEVAVLRALRVLARAVRRFGEGDLAARVPETRGYNELVSLGRTFNRMADTLAARHHEAIESQAQLRALSSHLRRVREAEAARISRELHDEIGQLLTSLKFELARIPAHCSPSGGGQPCAAALRASVQEMSGHVAVALDFVRRIASDLRPSALDQLGLAAGLEWLGRELESRTGLRIHVEAEEVEGVLDEEASVSMFRIAQEALTNVVRHSGAHSALVRLKVAPEGVLLEVQDDGQGMPHGAPERAASLGLVGMRERALLIGADFSMQSVPGQGTTVRVLAPDANERANSHAHSAGG